MDHLWIDSDHDPAFYPFIFIRRHFRFLLIRRSTHLSVNFTSVARDTCQSKPFLVAKGRCPKNSLGRHLGFLMNNSFHTNSLVPTSLTRVTWQNAALWLVTGQTSDLHYYGIVKVSFYPITNFLCRHIFSLFCSTAAVGRGHFVFPPTFF